MQVTPLERHIKASDLPPERLAANPKLSKREKVAELCRQFEALLLRQILAEAQKPVVKSSLTPDSTTAGIYRDLITQQLADSISKSGSFGLAKTLDVQLSRQLRPHASQDPSDGSLPSAGSAQREPPQHDAGFRTEPPADPWKGAATHAAHGIDVPTTQHRPVETVLRPIPAPQSVPADPLSERGAEELRSLKRANPAPPPRFHLTARHHG